MSSLASTRFFQAFKCHRWFPMRIKMPLFASASRAVPSSAEGSCTVGSDDKYAGQIETWKKMGKREGWPPHLSTAYKLYQLDWTAVLVLVEVKNLFPWWSNLKYINTSVLGMFKESVNHPIKKRNLSHHDGLLGSWSWDDQAWLRVQWHPSMVMSMGESSEKAKAQKTRFASV